MITMSDININSCRTCLINPGLISIHDKTLEITYCNIITLFTEVNVYEDGELPKFLCNNCANRLENVYLMKLQVEETDKRLKKILYADLTTKEIFEPPPDVGMPAAPPGVDLNIVIAAAADVVDESVDQIKTEDTPNLEFANVLDFDRVFVKVEDGNFGLDDDSSSDVKDIKDEDEDKSSDEKRSKIKTKSNKTCEVCGKGFTRTETLKIHQRVHTGEKPFECNICHKKFAQKSSVFAHLKTHSDEKAFICEVCSKQFKTKLHLKQHLTTHLPESEKRFKCDQCPRAFHVEHHLKGHKAIHEGKKPYKCSDCDKGFISRRYLNRHYRTVHLSIKRHSCTVCGKTFSNSGNLASHFRIHTGEKPYECNYCDARFNQSTPLVRHTQHHINRGDAIKIDTL